MRRLLLVPVVLGALLGAVACSSPGRSPAKGGSSADAESVQQFASCMRQHGQDVPDHNADSGSVVMTPPAGTDRAALDAALRACQQYLPGGVLPAPDPQHLEALRQYATCMRQHGIELSDPDPSTGGMQFSGRLANISRDQIQNDPTYKAAQAACHDKLIPTAPTTDARK